LASGPPLLVTLITYVADGPVILGLYPRMDFTILISGAPGGTIGFKVNVCRKKSARQAGRLDELSPNASSDKTGICIPLAGSKTCFVQTPFVTGTAATQPEPGEKPVLAFQVPVPGGAVTPGQDGNEP